MIYNDYDMYDSRFIPKKIDESQNNKQISLYKKIILIVQSILKCLTDKITNIKNYFCGTEHKKQYCDPSQSEVTIADYDNGNGDDNSNIINNNLIIISDEYDKLKEINIGEYFEYVSKDNFVRNDFYSESSLLTTLSKCVDEFKMPTNFNSEKHIGFIEKMIITNDKEVFVHADWHGSLKSLVDMIKFFKGEGFIDDFLKLKENVIFVFLGDYTDRGDHSIETLTLVLQLKMLNKNNVITLRGNHEDARINNAYFSPDDLFQGFVNKNSDLLTKVYERLPLAFYLGHKHKDETVFYPMMHGAIEPTCDIHKLLSDREVITQCVRKKLKFSKRVVALSGSNGGKLQVAANKIIQLVKNHDYIGNSNNPPMSWGDFNNVVSLGDPGTRAFTINMEFLEDYNIINEDKNYTIGTGFSGHAHGFDIFSNDKGKNLVIRLPVALGVMLYPVKEDIMFNVSIEESTFRNPKCNVLSCVDNRYKIIEGSEQNLTEIRMDIIPGFYQMTKERLIEQFAQRQQQCNQQ